MTTIEDKKDLGDYEWEDAHTTLPSIFAPGQQMSRRSGDVYIVRFAHQPDVRQMSMAWVGRSIGFHVNGGDAAADRLAAVMNERGDATLLAMLKEAGID